MCRLVAFPPGTPQNEALHILKSMESGHNGVNKDGFGYAFLTGEGKDKKFTVYKYALSFSELMKRKYPLLNHMPNNTWTIAHMRAASCGDISKENTHPFVINNKWAICHNGGFRRYGIVSLALSKYIHLRGTTDSEVAANLINIISPQAFALSPEIEDAGVYLCLNRDGTLEVIKNSGMAMFFEYEDKKVLISSQLSYQDYWDQQIIWPGWYKFNADGTFADIKKRSYGNFNKASWISSGGKYRKSARKMDIIGGNVSSYSIRDFHEAEDHLMQQQFFHGE